MFADADSENQGPILGCSFLAAKKVMIHSFFH